MTVVPEFLLGRRAALVGLGVTVLLLGVLVVTPIVGAFIAQREEIDDSLRQLAVYRAELGERSKLEAELKSLRLRGATVPGFLVADSPTLAEAQLEGGVKAIVETNGGEVRSAQIGETKNLGNVDSIAVQYDLSVPITHLRALLYAVESHVPYLFIDQVDITAPLGLQPTSSAGNTPQPEPELEVRWTIRSYRWSAK